MLQLATSYIQHGEWNLSRIGENSWAICVLPGTQDELWPRTPCTDIRSNLVIVQD